MNWTTAYDFGNESLRLNWMLMPVLFVVIGYGMSVMNLLSRSSAGKRIFRIIFGFVFGTFSLIFCVVTIPRNVSKYSEAKKVYMSKGYEVIEGSVENFSPMPYTGHKNESFTLNGVAFSYSDFDESYYGFNNTQSHGGPISQGRRVRLSYFVSDGKNIILKIEVPKAVN